MSDQIPIGSPPAPPGRHAAPPGWYLDPLNRGNERYWDGWQWSRTTRANANPQAQPHGPTGQIGPGRPPMTGSGAPEHPRWTPRSAAGHGRPSGGPPGAPVQPYGSQGAGGYGIAAPGTTADGVPLAGWGARAVAGLIDVVGIGLIGALAALPFYLDLIRYLQSYWSLSLQAAQQGTTAPTVGAGELSQYLTRAERVWSGLISSIIGVGYYALFWRLRSASVGQLILGLRVVPVDAGRGGPGGRDGQDGQGSPRLAWGTVVIRALIWVLPVKLGWLFLFWIVDCLSPLWHPKRQALHDLAAKTQVVKIR